MTRERTAPEFSEPEDPAAAETGLCVRCEKSRNFSLLSITRRC
jgi:hypothetical protein